MSVLDLYLLAFGAAWITTFGCAPLLRRWSMRVGLVDDPGHRKIHSKVTSLAGGLSVFLGLVLAVMLGALAIRLGWIETGFADPLRYGFHRRALQMTALMGGAAGMLILGLLDDRFELRPLVKFSGQFLIAFLVAASGLRVTLFIPSLFVSYLITILWILTITNAINFLDNMNGLCGGLGVIGAWVLAWSAAVQGHYLVALLAFASCGALLGFLPHNFPKASMFLGDSGSHLVGFWLAVLSILPHYYSPQNPNFWAVFSPLLILAVPLYDLTSVVILRWRRGQPFYVGDTNHLSHRLVRRGFSRTTAVLIIWLMAAILGTAAFLIQ